MKDEVYSLLDKMIKMTGIDCYIMSKENKDGEIVYYDMEDDEELAPSELIGLIDEAMNCDLLNQLTHDEIMLFDKIKGGD